MYIIQEQIDEGTWLDRYKGNDYEFISEMFHSFQEKYFDHKFRIIEVFYYV